MWIGRCEGSSVAQDLKTAANEFAARLTQLAGQHGDVWFDTKVGPNYIKVVLHGRQNAQAIDHPATFCFISRSDAPFEWRNFRAGDILPPKTWASPWKMDTGAVGNLFAPDRGMSYWVLRYGTELGLWPGADGMTR
jgi:hypothetical protein